VVFNGRGKSVGERELLSHQRRRKKTEQSNNSNRRISVLRIQNHQLLSTASLGSISSVFTVSFKIQSIPPTRFDISPFIYIHTYSLTHTTTTTPTHIPYHHNPPIRTIRFHQKYLFHAHYFIHVIYISLYIALRKEDGRKGKEGKGSMDWCIFYHIS